MQQLLVNPEKLIEIKGQDNTSHTFVGYNQRRSNRLKRGIAKYVRPTTSITVISMLVSNGDSLK